MKIERIKPKFVQAVLAIAVFLTMLLPRIFELDKFVFAEEPIWLMRSGNFYYALGQRDFSQTFQSYGAAGVTTMWIETGAYLIEFPSYRGGGQGYFSDYAEYDAYLRSNGVDPLDILRTSRVISVVLFSILISLGFLLIRPLVGGYGALAGSLLIAFEPWYLTLTRISHTDALQASFQFLATIAFIRYYRDRKNLAMLAFSGLMGGLAVLSKLPGLISGAFVAFVALVEMIKEWRNNQPQKRERYVMIGRHLKVIAIWTLFMLAAYILIWPFAWNHPAELIIHLLNKPGRFSGEMFGHSSLTITAGSFEGESPAGFTFVYLARYLTGYVWQTTPVAVFGLLVSAVAYRMRWGGYEGRKYRYTAAHLFWFFVIYTVFMTIPSKSSGRYYLAVYLPLDLLAGLGLAALSREIATRVKLKGGEWVSAGFLAGLLAIQMGGSLATFPYYSSYYNPLLGGSQRAGEVYFVGIGEGLNEAAEYLDAKAGAEKLTVMTWFPYGSFSYYFRGNVLPFNFAEIDGEFMPKGLFESADYLVFYNHLRYRPYFKDFMDRLENVQPEQAVWINGIEYARIYRVVDIKAAIEGE